MLLAVFGALDRPAPAYPVVFALGFAYFAMITSLSTVLQSNIADEVRAAYRWFTVDEYQDVNPLQQRLLDRAELRAGGRRRSR